MTNDLLYWLSFLLALVALTSQGAQANCIKALIGLMKSDAGPLPQGGAMVGHPATSEEPRGPDHQALE